MGGRAVRRRQGRADPGQHKPGVSRVGAGACAAADLKVRQVSEALVRHLHTFIHEVKPTEAEWEWGIRFLTETGEMCSATRQEFKLNLPASILVQFWSNGRIASAESNSTQVNTYYSIPNSYRKKRRDTAATLTIILPSHGGNRRSNPPTGRQAARPRRPRVPPA